LNSGSPIDYGKLILSKEFRCAKTISKNLHFFKSTTHDKQLKNIALHRRAAQLQVSRLSVVCGVEYRERTICLFLFFAQDVSLISLNAYQRIVMQPTLFKIFFSKTHVLVQTNDSRSSST
jgi:hypothetical protein